MDPKFHGHVVGAQGANIKAIQNETGAQVNVRPLFKDLLLTMAVFAVYIRLVTLFFSPPLDAGRCRRRYSH